MGDFLRCCRILIGEEVCLNCVRLNLREGSLCNPGFHCPSAGGRQTLAASFTCKISLFMGSGSLTNYLAWLLLVFLSSPTSRRRLLVSFVLLRKSPERLIMAGKVVGVPFHVDHAHARSFTRKEFRLM